MAPRTSLGNPFEVDPERLMQSVREALGGEALDQHAHTSLLSVLHRELVRLGSTVELGVASAVNTRVVSNPWGHSEVLLPLLRQGRLCFGLDGVCSMEQAEQELRTHIDAEMPRFPRYSPIVVQWRWGAWAPHPVLPVGIERLLERCARAELTCRQADALDQTTPHCDGDRSTGRL